MKKRFFKELKAYSKSHIIDSIGEDNLSQLIKSSIITRADDMYQFVYVGVIIIDEYVINIYPKYFKKYDKFAFKDVVKVLKKYQNSHDDIDYQNDSIEDISFNLLSMMIFFLEDYYEHGLYTNIENILQINGSGEIDWNRTVNYTDPIISNNRPYYVELYTKYKVNDLFDYFRLLHEFIITESSKRLEIAGLLDLFDLTPVELSSHELDDFGEIGVILDNLDKELNVVFSTQKRKLLKAMHTYLEERNSFSNENYLTVFGTNSYHAVWEDICKTVFRDKLNKPVFDKDVTLINLIKKPKWVLKSGKTYRTDTFRPDLIAIENNEFIILDAKYYNLKFDEDDLSGNPGLGDITKQYLYQLAFQDLIDEYKLSVKNALLFPKFDGDIENKGYVEIEILHDLDLENIQIMMLPANLMNKLYLQNKKLSVECMDLDYQ